MIYVLLYCHGPYNDEGMTREIVMVTHFPQEIIKHLSGKDPFPYDVDTYQDGDVNGPDTVRAARFIENHKE